MEIINVRDGESDKIGVESNDVGLGENLSDVGFCVVGRIDMEVVD